MMKQFLMVTTLAALVTLGVVVYAQAPAGHTAPKAQPTTEATPSAPTGEIALGAVRIPRRVKANGEVLPAGTYQVRLTPDTAKPDANGQTPQLERWVELRQGNQVKAKEVVSIVPASDVPKVQKDPPPKPGSYKVELLKGNEYVRV